MTINPECPLSIYFPKVVEVELSNQRLKSAMAEESRESFILESMKVGNTKCITRRKPLQFDREEDGKGKIQDSLIQFEFFEKVEILFGTNSKFLSVRCSGEAHAPKCEVGKTSHLPT